MSNDVFPRNNLPAAAVPWGRALEGKIRNNSYSETQVRNTFQIDNRGFAGQAGAITDQITELQSRSTQVIQVGEISASVALPNDYNTVTASSSLVVTPAPPTDLRPRKYLVLLSGIAFNNDPLNNPGFGSSGTVRVRINGIVSDPMAAPIFTSVPLGYLESFYLSSLILGAPSFTIEVFVESGNNTPSSPRTISVGVTECVATVIYQERA